MCIPSFLQEVCHLMTNFIWGFQDHTIHPKTISVDAWWSFCSPNTIISREIWEAFLVLLNKKSQHLKRVLPPFKTNLQFYKWRDWLGYKTLKPTRSFIPIYIKQVITSKIHHEKKTPQLVCCPFYPLLKIGKKSTMNRRYAIWKVRSWFGILCVINVGPVFFLPCQDRVMHGNFMCIP